MVDAAKERAFRNFLQDQLHNISGIFAEVQRHETSASINRMHLAGSIEGTATLGTDQWCQLTVMAKDRLSPDNKVLQAALLSSLIDGRTEIVEQALEADLIPREWAWIQWARTFHGSENDLLKQAAMFSNKQVRQLCGAVSFAATMNPEAVGPRLLERFFNSLTGKMLWHLLELGLHNSRAGENAVHAMRLYGKHPKLLFMSDVDLMLHKLISAYQGSTLENDLGTLKDCMGDLAKLAMGTWQLHHGQAQKALKTIKDIRLLSPAYPKGAIVAALASLECGKPHQAKAFLAEIDNPTARLQIRTRIAQAEADLPAELEALTDLHLADTHDPQVFIQLLLCLDKLGKTGMARELCLAKQELFFDHPEARRIIERHVQVG